MPSVAAGVVGRRWQETIRSAVSPVGLAFALDPMAGRTLLCIDRGAESQHLRIFWPEAAGGRNRWRSTLEKMEVAACRCGDQSKQSCRDPDQLLQPHGSLPPGTCVAGCDFAVRRRFPSAAKRSHANGGAARGTLTCGRPGECSGPFLLASRVSCVCNRVRTG